MILVFMKKYTEFWNKLPVYHMKFFLGDFNAMQDENIFNSTIRNKSIQPDNNDNGNRLVNFVTSENLIVKSTKCQNFNVHKYTWTSPDGITNIRQILFWQTRGSSKVKLIYIFKRNPLCCQSLPNGCNHSRETVIKEGNEAIFSNRQMQLKKTT